MNGLVASQCVDSGSDNKNEAVETVQTQELVHQGLQLPQEHLIMSTFVIDGLLYPIEEKSGVDDYVESSLDSDQGFQKGCQVLIKDWRPLLCGCCVIVKGILDFLLHRMLCSGHRFDHQGTR